MFTLNPKFQQNGTWSVAAITEPPPPALSPSSIPQPPSSQWASIHAKKKKNRRAFQKCYSNFNFFNCVILKPRNLQFSKSVYYLGKIRRMENAFK